MMRLAAPWPLQTDLGCRVAKVAALHRGCQSQRALHSFVVALKRTCIDMAIAMKRLCFQNPLLPAGAPVVVTIAATNRYHCLDEALVRPRLRGSV